jgi:hypothetical protein
MRVLILEVTELLRSLIIRGGLDGLFEIPPSSRYSTALKAEVTVDDAISGRAGNQLTALDVD